ncbi:MAG: hypothetical protein ACRDKI_01060 [Solirubrobacterales bacterium]
MPPSEFNPLELVRALTAHSVDFIVIGGFAATVHGSPHATFDLDIVPSERGDNLERLSSALKALEARIYVSDDEDPIELPDDPKLLERARLWNLTTKFGQLDIIFEPRSMNDFASAAKGSTEIDVGEGITIRVASLDSVIRSKEDADRPKDRAVLPDLRLLRELGEDR